MKLLISCQISLKYPEIRIQMKVTNRRANVINERIDIALRARSSLDDDPSLD